MPRRVAAGLAGVACAGIGAWAGQRLGGNAGTAGIGAGVGAVSGAFAPSVTGWLATRAEARNSAARTAELPRAVERPSRLLDPRRGVVGFTGREDELAVLTAWCEDGTGPTLRLVTGAGGTGKTRLALRFADSARQLGWHPHWVGDGHEAEALARVRAVTSGRVLLIVDYAETRTALIGLLREAATDRGAALRILLLARSVGPWWDQLGATEPAVRDQVTAAGPQGSPLVPAVGGLTNDELVRGAIPAFARELGVPPPEHVVLTPTAERARVLELHAVALVMVLNSIRDPSVSPVRVGLADVLGELLHHEERFWLATARTSGLLEGLAGLTPAAIRRIVAAACLLGAESEPEAFDILERVPDVPRSAKLAEWLRALYPPEPGSGEWLGTLQPDRLAEYHAVSQLAASPAFAERCLTGLTERQASRAVILLARASAEHDTAGKLLGQLLPLISSVVENLHAPHDTLISIANAIPYPTDTLAVAYAMITRRILDTLAPTAHAAERAGWLGMHGVALAQIGYPADAILVTREAAAIYRELAAGGTDRDRQRLAAALANLGVWSSWLGRPGEALPYSQEAVAIYRELATARPDLYRAALASELSNLGVRYSRLGRPSDALPPTEEAAATYRDLAAADPDEERYRVTLALALHNLGIRLADLGRSADALPPTQEAVTIRRDLAAADPGPHRPYLAGSLGKLGLRLTELGRPAEALPAAEEAVAICRELGAAHPGSYRADLARSLTELGVTLSELGRPGDALPAEQEAAAIRRELAAANPDFYGADLADTLSNLGVTLFELGRLGDADAVETASVTIRRELAAASSDRHRTDLQQSLANLAETLDALGRQRPGQAP
jgi:tetratricopeptide (TPR) repeat protein